MVCQSENGIWCQYEKLDIACHSEKIFIRHFWLHLCQSVLFLSLALTEAMWVERDRTELWIEGAGQCCCHEGAHGRVEGGANTS